MSFDYTQYQTYLATMMATDVSDSNFQDILPMCIDYAEQRIYKDLDLLVTRTRDSSTSCTAGTRLTALAATLVVLETLAVITPAATEPSAGTRNMLTPVSHDFIDMTYPNDSSAYQDVPKFYAPLIGQGINTGQFVLLGPSPDAAYKLEAIGTFRPDPLSVSNTNTVLTSLLPDLFMAASMVWMSGYQKNFGAQADDPKMAVSWEQNYVKLLDTARSEEFRKKYQESSWSSMITPLKADKARG